MKEEFLHHVWRHKRLPLNKLKLTDGRDLQVLDTGWLNNDAGPDFFNGKIHIDGMTWSGNIEIHNKSSDWNKHNHQHDPAYENVILHVVFQHDKDVILNNRILPTLELIKLINQQEIIRFNEILNARDVVPCQRYSVNLDDFATQMETALFQRLNRKAVELTANKNNDLSKLLYVSILAAFGGRLNKLPFIELAHTLPVEVLLKECWSPNHIEALFFGVAGFLAEVNTDSYYENLRRDWEHLKEKHQLKVMKTQSWKFSGTRPFNFPTFKLAQLSSFFQAWKLQFDPDAESKVLVQEFKSYKNVPVNEYWKTHFTFKKQTPPHSSSISSTTINTVLINGIAPYLVALSQYTGDLSYLDKAQLVLSQVNAEDNSIIKQWKELGVEAKSAADSQGLIELRNEFCNFRRCLNCAVGQNILNL